MSIEKRTIDILRHIESRGGWVLEAKLPHNDTLLMHRLINRGFIKNVGMVLETEETIFEITKEGAEEAKRTDN